MEPITIVGTGLAGYSVARELRKHDKVTPLRLISADKGFFYSKPMLSNALARGQTAGDLANANAAAMAQQLDAEILTETRVVAIDRDARRIEVGDAHFSYSKLVLAVGADPIALPLSGSGADRVLAVNNLGDYGRFRERLAGRERVVILGAGLIGCEFANDLRTGGYQVELIDLSPQALGRLVPVEIATALQRALTAIGVGWHLGTSVAAVEYRGDDQLRVRLDNDEQLEADLMLSAVGLRPQIGLAGAAGLEVDRGIVVDRFLRSSTNDIYALGDCAQVGGLVLPYVMPIMQCARALAKTLAGEPTELAYPAMPVVVKTPACPLVVCPPLIGTQGEWLVEGDDDGVKALFNDGEGQLRGFAVTGKAVAEKNALARLIPAWL